MLYIFVFLLCWKLLKRIILSVLEDWLVIIGLMFEVCLILFGMFIIFILCVEGVIICVIEKFRNLVLWMVLSLNGELIVIELKCV